jgi:SAM-dependent methyltransferase
MTDPLRDVERSYQELYRQHGYSPKSLGWDKGKQFLRFHQLTSEWNLKGAHILDVGCGFGDFVNYLRFIGVSDFTYTGVDLVGEFVAEGKKRHPGGNIRFIQGDFLSSGCDDSFDYAIASGTFNLKMEGVDGYEHIRRNMEKMFGLSAVGIGIDFLSDKVDFAHAHNFNSAPEKILSLAYALSRNLVLKNSYFPFEFSLQLYKDDSFRKETTVFTSAEKELGWLAIPPDSQAK